MKKSYLALGLVAAVAMSSCSNDENIPVNPNQPEGAEKLVPISLSMTNSIADVQVGTRGTGTVGSMDPASNLWQYEDIYVLMTSSDPKCLEEVDGVTPAWGFTSHPGATGPFLKEQFNGTFWTRPSEAGDGTNTTNLNYFLDQNEWWNGAPVNKYYPMNGESQFFAYYIDDAATETSTQLYDAAAAGDGVNYQTEDPHAYPVLNTAADGMSKTVNFKIDGSQDLMVGVATTTEAGQEVIASFSAKTARQSVVPSITMKHLLSRLTFNIIKGAESTDMVRLDAIRVLSKSQGAMTVAYAKDYVPTNIIAWDDTEVDPATFYLKEKAAYETVKMDADNFLVDAGGTTRLTATVNVQYIPWDDSYTGIHDKDDTGNYAVVTDPVAEEVWYQALPDGSHGYRVDLGRGTAWLLPGVNIDQADYNTFLDQVVFETLPNATLNDGKNALVDFTPIVLKDVLTNVGDGMAVGEAMFVQPGVDTYEMILDLTLKIRDKNDTFDDVTDDYNSTDLEEKLELPLTIKLNKEGADTNYKFEAGHSYAINITIYGLEKVIVEAVPEVWADGGDVNIGGDNDSENGDYTPAP